MSLLCFCVHISNARVGLHTARWCAACRVLPHVLGDVGLCPACGALQRGAHRRRLLLCDRPNWRLEHVCYDLRAYASESELQGADPKWVCLC
eukprot:364132-Chlamydomonas_euryale.AAC.6